MRYRYTCVVCSNFGLLQYLLYMNEEQIEHTFFITEFAVDASIASRLPHSMYVDRSHLQNHIWYYRFLFLLKYWWTSFTEIYAQDFSVCAPMVIRNQKYTLLENSPGMFKVSIYHDPGIQPFDGTKRTRKGIPISLKWGGVYGRTIGTNKQCKNRLITLKDDCSLEVLQAVTTTHVDLMNCWQEASDRKKSLICHVWDINMEQISSIKQCETIIFTQAFQDDLKLSDEEMCAIYGPYIEQYQEGGVLVKKHPRDLMSYKKYFPYVHEMSTKAPAELLSLVGLIGSHVKQAITVFSTAIYAVKLPPTCKIIWLGTKNYPKLLKHFGKL